MHPPPFGKISLEGLLSRAQTIFTTGYKFQGELNLANLQQTFEVIADAIGKLSQQLEFRSQSDFGWISSRNLIGQRFHVISADNLDQEVKELSARAFQVRALSNNYPINMTVIHSSNQATADQFVIVLQCAHEYIDARSSELIFKLMVDYYNALARSDAAAMELVVAEARQLRTISTPEMVRLLVSVGYNPMANVKELESYPS
ncbi:MAG TPA: hypothetical protein VJB68_04385, partial [Methylophilaceae bacterium]|nr:hypothetical protein [Methylophilaceae bacterium]